MKFFVYGIIGVVAGLIIAGFAIIGSPKEERMREFDMRRVEGLNALQYEIVSYWQNKWKLPENLAALRDAIRGVVEYTDPETGVPYEYAVKGDKQFELCAVFSLQSEERGAVPVSPASVMPTAPVSTKSPIYKDPYGDLWKHDAGRVCFERTIDPEFYPPAKR